MSEHDETARKVLSGLICITERGNCPRDISHCSCIAAVSAALAAAAEAERKKYAAILERERTAAADSVNAIKKAIAGRRWLYDGERGSYAYDDDRFYAEFKAAIDEIEAAVEPMRAIARDWSNCPETTIEVQTARAPDAIKAAAEAARRETAQACAGIAKNVAQNARPIIGDGSAGKLLAALDIADAIEREYGL